MKKALLITGALIALTASQAFAAGGINLSWTDCGLNGTATKTFACNVNTGQDLLVCSFSGVSCGLDSLNGQEGVIDIQFSGATVPGWWQFKTTGSCRGTTAVTVSYDFGLFANCADVWLGAALGDFVYQPGIGGANRLRLKYVAARGLSTAGPWNDKRETYSAYFAVKHVSTTLACATGCVDAACIVFNQLKLTQNPGATRPADQYCLAGYGGTKALTAPLDRRYVNWQSVLTGCDAITPTKNATWGQVKSLYR